MDIAEVLAKAVIRELKGYLVIQDRRVSQAYLDSADIQELVDRVVTLAFMATQVTQGFQGALVTRVTRDIVVSLESADSQGYQVTPEFLDSLENQVLVDIAAWKEVPVIRELLDPRVTQVKMAAQVILVLKEYLGTPAIQGIVEAMVSLDTVDKKD